MVLHISRPLTVESELQWAREFLAPSVTASLDATLLLGHVLGRERSWVLAHGEEGMTVDVGARYRTLIERRAVGVPVAYLRGCCEWFGMKLTVTPDVLVPRPETEQVVEQALLVAVEREARVLVDVGTGSGAIAIQLARSLPDSRVVGIDISAAALEVARHNAAALGVSERITWLEGSVLEPLGPEPDLLVGNLPYLSENAIQELDRDVRHEPALALYAGLDGLDLYRALFEQRRSRGWTAPVVIEIDPRQASNLRSMVRDEFGEESVTVHRDYAGHDRILVVAA